MGIRSSEMLRKALSLALLAAACSLFAWAHAVLVPDRWQLGIIAYCASAILLIIREAALRPPVSRDTAREITVSAALIAVIATAAFFRLRYVYSVPLGFHNETIGEFLRFPDKLLREGFIYSPVWGYASTGHCYLVALVWKVFGQTFTTLRFYLAFMGILSVLIMFFWLKKMFGVREALLGSILLASSPYHQWASRYGSNAFIHPFAIMLFFWALYTMTCSRRKILCAVLASIAFVFGMHAYWVFALEACAALIFILYCVLTERGFFTSNWRGLVVLVVLTAVLLIPFASYFLQDFYRANYMTGTLKVGAGGIGATSQVHKYLANLKNCYFAYLASTPKTRHAGSALVLVSGGIGFLLCLSKFARSRGHALLLILFLVHLAGLTLTVALFHYLSYLLVFWLAFAAVAGGGGVEKPLLTRGRQGVAGRRLPALSGRRSNLREGRLPALLRQIHLPGARRPGDSLGTGLLHPRRSA